MPDRWMTYEEAGELFGLSGEAIRKRARRLGWRVENKGNEPNVKARVLVPDGTELRPSGHPAGRPAGDRQDDPTGHPRDAATVADIMAALRDDRRTAETERDAARAEAVEARREAEQHRERAARAEGERDGLREALRRADTAADEAQRRVNEAAARLQQSEERLVRAQAATREAQERAAARERDLAARMAGGRLTRAWRAFRQP